MLSDRMTVRFLLCLTFATLICGSPLAEAQESKDRTKYAITEIKNAGSDLFFQGEYTGNITTTLAQTHYENYGLQVISLGDGLFEGLLYVGGLPGSGWNGVNRTLLQGRKIAGTVQLAGAAAEVQIIKNQYALVSWHGYPATGYLSKVDRFSPTLGAEPMPGALILFNGEDNGQLAEPQITEEGLLMEGTETTGVFEDFYLHIEFKLPYMPYARGQARANSGVYIQSRYEVQILDSFGRIPEFNFCGALYRQKTPDINMCLPPLLWQTYDMRFKHAKFDVTGNKISDANLTVWHNGIKIQDNVSIETKTGSGQLEGNFPLPTKFQDHSDPVRFRNMWIVDYSPYLPEPLEDAPQLEQVSVSKQQP
ncbi:hypothetical protein Pla110_22750 [Polystyrenella longa]|uniref:3-keto-alpha-glucoside-1,2-lyase/3-keto-2-hydroxy-glucal hydratase domain-containing protein n=1 Tax=Polystyrenella longa TaxID=2528007 RepID=A0A518CMW4_9PLAN|nr:DUF1080 domain-containing protein [Polystyrenella longa]QDU80544.1 hypothetical protein Pla110_22750 [Polystyrenella longa]